MENITEMVVTFNVIPRSILSSKAFLGVFVGGFGTASAELTEFIGGGGGGIGTFIFSIGGGGGGGGGACG